MADTRRQTTAGQGAPAGDRVAGRSERAGREVPSGPAKMSGGSWLAAGKRTVREFGDDALTDRAAALTYYAVLSIFPGLLVVVSLLGLVGKSATQPLIINLGHAAPGAVRQIFLHAVRICKAARPPPVALRSSASSLRCGPHRAISRPSCVPLTSSTTCQKAGRSGRPHRCAWALPC